MIDQCATQTNLVLSLPFTKNINLKASTSREIILKYECVYIAMLTCHNRQAIKEKGTLCLILCLFVWAYVHSDNTAFCHCEGSAKTFHSKWARELLTRGFNRLQLSLAAFPIYSVHPRWEYGMSLQRYTLFIQLFYGRKKEHKQFTQVMTAPGSNFHISRQR